MRRGLRAVAPTAGCRCNRGRGRPVTRARAPGVGPGRGRLHRRRRTQCEYRRRLGARGLVSARAVGALSTVVPREQHVRHAHEPLRRRKPSALGAGTGRRVAPLEPRPRGDRRESRRLREPPAGAKLRGACGARGNPLRAVVSGEAVAQRVLRSATKARPLPRGESRQRERRRAHDDAQLRAAGSAAGFHRSATTAAAAAAAVVRPDFRRRGSPPTK
jgi:hypothetical protein